MSTAPLMPPRPSLSSHLLRFSVSQSGPHAAATLFPSSPHLGCRDLRRSLLLPAWAAAAASLRTTLRRPCLYDAAVT
jgi:hypothetical protein